MTSPQQSVLGVRLSVIIKVACTVGGVVFFAASGLAQTEKSLLLPGVDQRAISESPLDSVDFQKHISPLLGRVGCNNRNCHGSFQGQGGLQLSLFGYDFAADHLVLLADGRGRVDLESVEDSLVLTKPSGIDEHGGGEIFAEDSWQYRVLKAWIEKGAPPTTEPVKLLALEVVPAALNFSESDQQMTLQVIAVWEDGTREDVTALSRFQANDLAICSVDETGLVTSGGFGDTHIVVFYDNGVTAIPVLRPYPVQDLPDLRIASAGDGETEIDRFVGEKLRLLNLPRSELADDLTFLRRVSLDIAGTLPSPESIRQFLADSSPDKRARKIDELLETPAYISWQTTFLCDISGNNTEELNRTNSPIASQQWFDWIRHRVADNVPYNEIVAGLVVSHSRQSDESLYDFCSTMSEMARSGQTDPFVVRAEMPYYWMRNDNQDKDSRAIAYAQNFLGLQIQCAQCHKHPFDRWTQQDFAEFSRFFTGMEIARGNGSTPEEKADYQRIMADLNLEGKRFDNQAQRMARDAIRAGGVMPFPYLQVTKPRLPRAERNQAERGRGNRGPLYYTDAQILGGPRVSFKNSDDVRELLMGWTEAADNPYFARVYVNRVWARYFGIGIVNPVDDLNSANPPSNPALLDYLAEGFIASGFDMKWVHREIANSRTYQTSWQPVGANAADERNFSRALPRRLPAELVVDSIAQASANDRDNLQFLQEVNDRAVSVPGTTYGRAARGNRNNAFALTAFGRSTRSNNCDCDRSDETSLIQTVYIQNDRDVHQWIADREGWVSQVVGPEINPRQLNELRNQLSQERQQLKRQTQRREVLVNAGRDVPVELEERIEKVTTRISERQAQLDSLNQPRATLSVTEMIEEAYLRTVSRFPTTAEIERCQRFIEESKSLREGLSGVLWTLINTKEFVVNH
jgi:hypothetical protein